MRYAKVLSILVLSLVVITLGFLNYTNTHTPLTTPEVILTYNKEKISSVHGEHVWMDTPLDGNSWRMG
ncbi:hypothetical protein JHL18_17770 [Clostridium sp. YIM B02505]|uniref:Uncharacterized protein n=1 Tax=Clostridium yunnanense TaxID=2800325 RepID=A0ABS1ET02_9CLOT|nr:hypothetical protein [Clostridium yunnanense]MBK1812470.1 hypothetical protein [Clostridium yunnanense]